MLLWRVGCVCCQFREFNNSEYEKAFHTFFWGMPMILPQLLWETSHDRLQIMKKSIQWWQRNTWEMSATKMQKLQLLLDD